MAGDGDEFILDLIPTYLWSAHESGYVAIHRAKPLVS